MKKKLLLLMLALMAMTTAHAQSEVWSVRLDDASTGTKKQEVIKVVRTELGLVLKDAYDLVMSAPCILLQDVTLETANDFATKLRDAGATVTVGIEIGETKFPDGNFRSYLSAQDYGSDGMLTEAEIAAVTNIDVRGESIKDLTGIEHFTALTELWCYNNQLTSLDVSKNTALTNLQCSYNQLTSLDVSQNTALKELYCHYNQLTALDVSKNTALTTLYCYSNQIKGTAMQALVNSLPKVTSGDFYVIDTNDSNEQNVITKAQVKIATDKSWKVYDYNGGSKKEYAGSEETAIGSIEVSLDEKGRYYSLDGKHIKGVPTQKGVYIHNGKKVMVK